MKGFLIAVASFMLIVGTAAAPITDRATNKVDLSDGAYRYYAVNKNGVDAADGGHKYYVPNKRENAVDDKDTIAKYYAASE